MPSSGLLSFNNSFFYGEGASCNGVLSSTYLQHELNDLCAVFQFAQTTFRSDFTERYNYFHHNCVHSGLLIKLSLEFLAVVILGKFLLTQIMALSKECFCVWLSLLFLAPGCY